MILSALYNYYHRKAAYRQSGSSQHSATTDVAPPGWEFKELPYLIVLHPNGSFAAIESTREGKRARKFRVPKAVKRTVQIVPNLLWDNLEYALGKPCKSEPERVQQMHAAFIERIERELGAVQLPSVEAVLAFLRSDPLAQIEHSSYAELWQQMCEENPFITFRIDGAEHACVADDIFGKWSPPVEDGTPEGICLVTGTRNYIERLHPAIKGVRGANSTGASLVSFNAGAFESYGKSQSFNSPVSIEAAFAYTTALNMLLDRDSRNKVVLGDTTIVFWAEEPSSERTFDLESQFGWYIEQQSDNPDRSIEAVRALFEAHKTGKLAESTGRFYVLGLAPNAGRVAVRFFRVGTGRQFGEHIRQHFEDLRIVRGPNDPEFLPLRRLLQAVVLQGKLENLAPNLEGQIVESILDGVPYPATLLQQCIRRIRAEQSVTYPRAAILKASLLRLRRMSHHFSSEVTMALDPTNTRPAYLLGRLFAVLERIQEAAQPGINATIRDRFYGAASATPVAVFPQLLKLKNHHIGKLDSPQLVTYFEKLVGQIIEPLTTFPAQLSMQEQAEFALGYYHQRQDFFKPKESAAAAS
jgi:CRISPR-associated protein Csd1